MKLLDAKTLNCPDLTELRYEFDNVGYCSIGKDYNCKHVIVELVPDGKVPDYDDVVKLVHEMAGCCVSASTEERTQKIADLFFDLCKPKNVAVTTISKNATTVDYVVKVQKHAKK